jgi:hypothetical protein
MRSKTEEFGYMTVYPEFHLQLMPFTLILIQFGVLMLLLVAIISNYTIKIMVRSKNGAIAAGHECNNFIDIGYVQDCFPVGHVRCHLLVMQNTARGVSWTLFMFIFLSQNVVCFQTGSSGSLGSDFCSGRAHLLAVWHLCRLYHL